MFTGVTDLCLHVGRQGEPTRSLIYNNRVMPRASEITGWVVGSVSNQEIQRKVFGF